MNLKLLGVPCLTLGDRHLPALADIDVALLAVLALEGKQPRQQVAALLWPDADAAGAATNLRQRIYRLKQLAGRSVIEGQRSIGLPADLQHDMQDYPTRLGRDPHYGRGDLLGALTFPTNEVLATWLSGQRESLAQTRIRVLAHAAQSHTEQKRLEVALDFVRAWLYHAPVDEQAHRLHVRLLYQQGNRAAATAAYRQCEQTLRSELGIEPSAETRGLLAQLREYRLPAPVAVGSIPITLLRPPRLVERDKPWIQLSQAAEAGLGLVVEAEAGMGKSRLLSDFVASREGWCLVSASAGDSALPLALLARLLSVCVGRWGRPDQDWVCRELARLAPEAGTPSDDAFANLRLGQALRAALKHWRLRGLLGVALDDLHHADPSSLALLLPLVNSTEEGRVPWLLATRPSAATDGLEDFPRITLQALSVEAVRDLVASLCLENLHEDEWAPLLVQRTGGNPLFVVQTLTAAFEAGTLQGGTPSVLAPLPTSLSTLLVARLEKLSVQARSIARLASVAGVDFTLELACQLLQQTPAVMADAWQELHGAQVMRDGGFAHDLIRDACQQITPADVKGLMHAQVARALLDRHAPAARVAAHWEAAARWPEAALAYELAAAHAHECDAMADELLKLKAAARCHLECGDAKSLSAATVLEHRALHLRIAIGQLTEETLQDCESLLARAGDEEQLVAAQRLLAYYWAERFEPERALPWAEAALQGATRHGHEREALLAAQRVGAVLSRLGRHEEALQCMRPRSNKLQMLTRDERLNWRSDFGSALDYADQRQEALQVLADVVEEATAHGRLSVAAAALSLSSNVLGYLGRTRDGLVAAERSIELYRRSGLEGDSLLVDECNRLGMLRDLGHYSNYLARAEQLPDEMRAAGSEFWAANAEHDLATAYAWLGRADLSLRVLSAQPFDKLAPLMQVARLVTRARLARDFGVGGGQPGASPQALLQQAQQRLASIEALGRGSHFSLSLALQAARDLEPEAGLMTTAGLKAEGVRRENWILVLSCLAVRLRMLMAVGQASAAAAEAGELLRRIETFGPPTGIYAPELWWLAHLALRSSEPAAARVALGAAAEWIRNRALHDVPEVHRDSFLTRNPINRAVLTASPGLASLEA